MKNLKQPAFLWLIGVFCFITLVFTGCKPAYTSHEHQWTEWWWTATGPITDLRATRKCPCGQTETITGTLEEIITNQLPSYSAGTLFKEWLAAQPDNTPETAYPVKLNLEEYWFFGDTLKGFQVSVSTEWGYYLAYSNRNKYVNLDLSGSTFTAIGNFAFGDCDNLTSIILPASVTAIGDSAFANCNNLTSIILPTGVTSIGDFAFSYCFSLTSITIPAGVTSIGDFAFSGCSDLTSVTFVAGSNISGGNFGDSAFPERKEFSGENSNSLKNAYLAANPKAGTYTRAANGDVWTKQP